MIPIALAVMGMGLVLKNMGRQEADEAEAMEEMRNASFYREQAKFAEDAGKRTQSIFDNESVILLGDQESGLSASGIGQTTAGAFLSREKLFRDQESDAIQRETDSTVRLAYLRADQSQRRADTIGSGNNNAIMGDVIGAVGGVL